jgi:PPIC-type PPIASE domain
MTRYEMVCFLIGSLFWGQIAFSQSKSAVGQPADSAAGLSATASDQTWQAKASNTPPDAPVITIDGLCDDTRANKTTATNCKTVITRAQFERVIDAVQPGMPKRARQEFALDYVDFLMMAKKAEQMGLDNGTSYEEQMKLARIQVLSRDLKKVIQEKASQISEKDIEDYYHDNAARFEKAEVERIYVPKAQQVPLPSSKMLSDADKQKCSQESEQTMKEEADSLRARAVAGEEFSKLQADSYQAAGIRSAAPATSMVIRRVSLPPNQVLVMDLKPGEVSSVLADPNGFDIYKVKTKDTLSLDQVREEIKATLRSQRIQDEMRGIQDSATPTLDESYFAR